MQKFNSWEDAFGLNHYDWNELTDGSIWKAEQGIDFDCDPISFRTLLQDVAQRQKLEVITLIKKSVIKFQFLRESSCKSLTAGTPVPTQEAQTLRL